MKRLGQLAILILVIQWILSFTYYLERIGFLDAAFVLVKIINEGHPTIMVGRYGAILTQSWPWVGVHAGWSLDTLMVLYSMSFTVLNLFVGLLLYRLEQYKWIVLLIGYFLLFYTDGFFWTNNEIHQAFALFALGAGYFDYLVKHRPDRFIAKVIVAALCISLAILTHPLMLVVVGFYLLFNIVSRHWLLNRIEQLLMVFIIFLTGVVKYLLSSRNWYDSQKLDMVNDLYLTDWLSVYNQPLFSQFFEDLLVYYQPALIAILVLVLILSIMRQWWTLLATVIMMVVHISMVSVVVGEFHRFYVESQWMLMAFFIWLPIVQCYEEIGNRWKGMVAILFIGTVGWWGIRIADSADRFSSRLTWHEQKIKDMSRDNIQKMILQDVCTLSNYHKERMISPLCPEEEDILQMVWGLPAESLLLSSRKGMSRTYIEKTYFTGGDDLKAFHNCFDTVSIEAMNERYFDLNPDEIYRFQPLPVY